MDDVLRTVLEEIVGAQVEEVDRLLKGWVKTREEGARGNLAGLEVAMREWALRVGRTVFERLIVRIAESTPQCPALCSKCSQRMVTDGTRRAKLHTSMGDVSYERHYARCRTCGRGAHVLDEELGLDEQRNSPALQKMVSLAGAVAPFEKASDLLGEIGSIPIGAGKVERITEEIGQRAEQWMSQRQQGAMAGVGSTSDATPERLYVEADGTTVPMRVVKGESRSSDQRTPGKVEYKEVKIGAVVEAMVDDLGQPYGGGKTYTGTFQDAEACVQQVVSEAKARGSNQAREIVLLNDGGAWLWNRLPQEFPGQTVTQILDWCHPSERLGAISGWAFGEGTAAAKAWAEHQRERLYEGKVGDVIGAIECLNPTGKEAQEFVRQSLGYFREHSHRMNYGELRANGYFIGSGVIESACKHIVGQRLKQAGMKWSREHVPRVLALRVCRASGWWERFWSDLARRPAA